MADDNERERYIDRRLDRIEAELSGSVAAALRRELADAVTILRTEINALKELLQQRATAAETTLTVAKESLNEMRQMATDRDAQFLLKGEYFVQHKALGDKVEALADFIPNSRGFQKGLSLSWGVFIAVLGLLLSAALIFVDWKSSH